MIQIKPFHILFLLLLISIGLNIYFFSKPTEKVKTDPVFGSMAPVKPTYQKPVGEPLTIAWKKEKEIVYVETEGAVNDSIIRKFTDSITTLEEQLQIVTDLATYRKFTHTFEDDYLKATIEGLSLGYLEEVSIPSYEIKAREIEVPKQKLITVGFQAGYGYTIYGDTPYVGFGLNVDLEQGIRKLLQRF